MMKTDECYPKITNSVFPNTHVEQFNSDQKELAQQSADSFAHPFDLRHRVFLSFWPPPDRRRPAEIALKPPDQVNVKLGHQIAESRDVELVGPKLLLQKIRDRIHLRADPRARFGIKPMQLKRRGLWHQNEPWHQRIVHQQEKTVGRLAQPMTVGAKTGMELEIWHY